MPFVKLLAAAVAAYHHMDKVMGNYGTVHARIRSRRMVVDVIVQQQSLHMERQGQIVQHDRHGKGIGARYVTCGEWW